MFTPVESGLIDLSDVQVLSRVPSPIGGVDEDNLLILSQNPAASSKPRAAAWC
jgi:hypothetical protein